MTTTTTITGGLMTELEEAILGVLKRGSAPLSSSSIHWALPAKMRPRGKNTVCQALVSLIEKGLAHKILPDNNPHAKKFTRYAHGTNPIDEPMYQQWPFVPNGYDQGYLDSCRVFPGDSGE